jgi:DNA-binding response OmpR family regulator
VIFLSARGEESDVQAGLNAGAVDYIQKPIAPDQLAEKVKSYLHRAGI